MSNQADSQNQQNDEEVIDLTEEVGEEIDDFALTMPEFRVPEAAQASVEPKPEAVLTDDTTGRIPPEVVAEIEQADRQNGAAKETHSDDLIVQPSTQPPAATEPPPVDEPIVGTETKEMEPKFDRSELVKTVQMDSFERPPEIMLGGPMPIDGLLQDQRFAPDVLVRPPRVLTKKWQDGARTQVNGATGGGGFSLETRESMAQTMVPGVTDSVNDAMSEAETLDLDSPDLVVEEVKPPPPKSPPEMAKPPKRQTEPLPKVVPEVRKQETRPAPPSDDDDLNGIVQELLEEKKQEDIKLTPEQKKRQNWCAELFDEEYLRTLPKALKRETEREVKFITESLGLQPQSRVLDLACGFGRHSVELAEAGFEVAGLDLSMVLLQHALSEAQRRNLSIKFIHGDMRELNFPEIFDGCFSWQTSFGYFDDATNLSVLRGIHASLKPRGRLLLDIVNRDHLVPKMPARTWWEGIECVFLEEVEFDYKQSILHTKRSFIYEDGSPPREYSSYIRLYGLHELRLMLETAGFRLVEVSGATYHRGAFLGASSSKLIVLAEKV